ncbi:MAG: hypothetical protein U0359_09420 [Byssovorax sp.]
MKRVEKGAEPAALHDYRAVPGATYDGHDFGPVKDQIRDGLLRDQHALCAYCMRRISKKTRPHPTKPDAQPLFLMKIDHWRSQERHPELQLSWTNMIGACPGGEGQPGPDQTCDTKKGEHDITLNPQTEAHLATLHCTSSGVLRSTNAQFQEDIDQRLNLNHRILVEDRKASLKRALDRLSKKFPGTTIPISAVRRLAEEIETPALNRDDPPVSELPEHSHVLRLWAKKRYPEAAW